MPACRGCKRELRVVHVVLQVLCAELVHRVHTSGACVLHVHGCLCPFRSPVYFVCVGVFLTGALVLNAVCSPRVCAVRCVGGGGGAFDVRGVQAAVSRLENDVHSPDMYRVIGPLSNSVHFANAYQCSANSTMGRSLTPAACLLW
jgi:hypothetical protein